MEHNSPKQCFWCFLLLMAETNKQKKKSMSLYSHIKVFQPPEAKLYLGSIRFYFKNACIIYIGTLQNISVHLKDVLAKTWRKLKVLGSPAHLSLNSYTPHGMLSSTTWGVGSPSWSPRQKRYFQYCCKVDEENTQRRRSLYLRSSASSFKACDF